MICGKIYVHENKINKKCYVGQTTARYMSNRWGQNGNHYKGCVKFWNAIQKYGWDNFNHVILPEIYMTKEALNEAEITKIAEFNSVNSGYNLDTGGNSGNHSSETKKRMAKDRKNNKNYFGRVASEDTRKKLSIAAKGKPAHNKGIPISERQKASLSALHKGKKASSETRAKMSATHKTRYEDPAERLKTSLATKLKLEDPKMRQRMSERSKTRYENPIERQKISEANKHRYEDPLERIKTSEIMKKIKANFLEEKSPNAVAVFCVETKETFLCIKTACKKYGVFQSNIAKSCKNNYFSCGKTGQPPVRLHWKYIKKEETT